MSAIAEELKVPLEIATPETDRELTKLFQPSPLIMGISSLGKAYNRESNYSEISSLSLEVSKAEEIPGIVETKPSSALKELEQELSEKPPPETVNSEPLAPSSAIESEFVETANEWEPDLTGWRVSIG